MLWALLIFSIGVCLALVKRYMGGATADFKNVDLTGKLAVVTGCNEGIGFEIAKKLGELGANVVLACKSTKKAEEAARKIGPRCTPMKLDLASFEAIREFAAEFSQRFNRCDIFVANAGVGMRPYVRFTKDRFEYQFGINYLGNFLLINLLMPIFRKSSTRIVTLSSISHYHAPSCGLDWDRILNPEKSYHLWGYTYYAQSKLALTVFTKELQRRFPELTVAAAHPGGVRTRFFHQCVPYLLPLGAPFLWLFMKSPEEGAQTPLHCAVNSIISGGYYADCTIREPRKEVLDQAFASQLWARSEKFVGLSHAVPRKSALLSHKK